MDGLTAFGLFAVTAMLVAYALEACVRRACGQRPDPDERCRPLHCFASGTELARRTKRLNGAVDVSTCKEDRMVRMLTPVLLAGALVLAAAPAYAAFITLPFVGDIAHPDMDPFHLMTPEAAAAPAPEAPKKMKRHTMKKKMMKKKMG